jgi:hypothetical protein
MAAELSSRQQRERDFHDETFAQNARARASKFYAIHRASQPPTTASTQPAHQPLPPADAGPADGRRAPAARRRPRARAALLLRRKLLVLQPHVAGGAAAAQAARVPSRRPCARARRPSALLPRRVPASPRLDGGAASDAVSRSTPSQRAEGSATQRAPEVAGARLHLRWCRRSANGCPCRWASSDGPASLRGRSRRSLAADRTRAARPHPVHRCPASREPDPSRPLRR